MGRVVITHTDLDGISCAIIAKYFKVAKDFIFLNYGDEDTDRVLKKALKYDSIWVTDLCLEPEWYEQISKKSDYKIIDHHEGTSEYANDPNVIFDISKSGTMLLFEYLRGNKRIPQIVLEFALLVNTYDMWQKDSVIWESAHKLHRLLYRNVFWDSTGYDKYKRFITNQLMKFNVLSHFDFTKHEQKLIQDSIDKEEREYKEAIDSIQRRRDSKGRKFGLIKAPANISSICDRILSRESGMDYIICINTFKKAQGKVSGRTKREELDLNTIEGIQGHAQAAGGEFDPLFLDMLWHNEYRDIEDYSEFLSAYKQIG